ncbi:hypothetical protein ACVIJ6_000203 [Bradyrhizobium sp. USDA 4369]
MACRHAIVAAFAGHIGTGRRFHAARLTRMDTGTLPDDGSHRDKRHDLALSRRDAPELLPERTLAIEEGAGNAGRWPLPMARLQKDKQAAVTTGPAGSSGIPCAMGYRLIRDLPGAPGFLATIPTRSEAST